MSVSIIFVSCAFVECDIGKKPVLIALVDEDGNIALNSYIVPNGTIQDWRTEATSLTSFQDLLECNPIHMDILMEHLRYLIHADTVLVGHQIGPVLDALGIRVGEDCAAVFDIADWFSLKLSPTLTQYFPLAHQVKWILGDEIPDECSGEHDPLVDAQYLRILYLTYHTTPFSHPIMRQLRQKLYNEYPKEKRVLDPAVTILVQCIPTDFSPKDIRRLIPTQVQHCVERILPIDWGTPEAPKEDSPTEEGQGPKEEKPQVEAAGPEEEEKAEEKAPSEGSQEPPEVVKEPKDLRGSTTILCKSAQDVRQILLRLHSNPEEWDWQVKKEGQMYVHKENAMVLKEVDNPDDKLYIHSVPDEWTELEVKAIIVPMPLQPHVKEVKTTQFKKTKSGAFLGRTHIIFNEDWCVWEMLRMLNQGHDPCWEWGSQGNGNVAFAYKREDAQGQRLNVMVEPVVPITWDQLMTAA